MKASPTVTSCNDPLDATLWGEYARILLVCTAACSAAYWAVRLGIDRSAVVPLVINLSLLAAIIDKQFAGLPRLTLLALLAIGLIASVSLMDDALHWWSPLPIFSPAVTLLSLLVLASRDLVIAARTRFQGISFRMIGIGGVVMLAALYMIVGPMVASLLEQFQSRPGSYQVEDLTVFEMLRIRSAKLVIFAIFAYCGACVGSFINVVAASAPRGESIVLRSSACPSCKAPIRRIDNLPIISYLRLGGRCRHCKAKIPARYLVVEVVSMAIFSLLFLYELVTGAANVPGFRHYHYAGIIWIILYTKWPVVGIYFYHCALFSCLLMLALMEIDRLRCPRWMAIALVIGFVAAAITIPTMLPVSFDDQIPLQAGETLPDWARRALSCLIGVLGGWLVAKPISRVRLRGRQASSSLTLATILVGSALGWQAMLTIAALWLVVPALLKLFGGRGLRPRWLTPTTLLLIVAMLHHPVWKWLTWPW